MCIGKVYTILINRFNQSRVILERKVEGAARPSSGSFFAGGVVGGRRLRFPGFGLGILPDFLFFQIVPVILRFFLFLVIFPFWKIIDFINHRGIPENYAHPKCAS